MKLRPSSLWSFMACPFKYKYSVFDWNPKDLYFGSLLHAAARWLDVAVLFEDYIRQLNPDLRVKKKFESLLKLAKEEYLDNKDYIVLDETELLCIEEFWDKQVDFWGTPDRVLYKDWKYFVDDFKTSSSFAWYENENMREIQAQPFLYSYMFMKIYKIKDITFRFIVFSKSNWLKRIFEKQYTFKEVEQEKNKLIEKYLEAESSGQWDAKSNPYCFFCPLKEWFCPINNQNQDEIF